MAAMMPPPEVPASTPMVIAQAAPAPRVRQVDYVLKSCEEVEHASSEGGNGNFLAPQVGLARLLKLKDEALDSLVRLETPPIHGQLRRIAYYKYDETKGRGERSITQVYAQPDGSFPKVPQDTGVVRYVKASGEEYRYITTPGYYGMDRVVFSVEYKGMRYRIDLELIVSDFVRQTDEGSRCSVPKLLKIAPKLSGAG